jgi:hypothetical protein
LGQRFHQATTYDIVPLAYLSLYAARARGISILQLGRENGTYHADRALTGFSGIVLKLLSHEAIALWLPRISAWYHDFGHIETRSAAPGLVRGVRVGMPRICVQQWAVTAMEFAEHVLERCGARDVRVSVFEPEQEGQRHGQPLFRVPFELRWGSIEGPSGK